jgi:hypothetical protein
MQAIDDAEAAGFALNREITENEWWCGRFVISKETDN